MRILFADETEREAGSKKAFFCICSIDVEEEVVPLINFELDSVASRYGLKNLKESRKLGLPETRRLEITKEIIDILSSHSVRVRASVMGNYTITHSSREQLYLSALSFLVERWCFTLQRKSISGMVLFDTVGGKLESKIRKLFYQYIREASLTLRAEHQCFLREHLYPNIMFCDDDHTPLIQVADLIGTSLNDAIVKARKEDSSFTIASLPTKNKFLALYWPLFMRSPSNQITGWGIKFWD